LERWLSEIADNDGPNAETVAILEKKAESLAVKLNRCWPRAATKGSVLLADLDQLLAEVRDMELNE
jgi:hypothetical protein